MLRVSKLTDYATVLMAALAELPADLASASDLAERAQIELPTVSKLLKQLAGAGLIESRRGVNGGYRLAHASRDISVFDIVTAIEGPIGITECSVHEGACHRETRCLIQHNWRRISAAIGDALRHVTLEELLQPEMAKPVRGKAVPIRVTVA
ncbi:MAG: SUF system Fe-S cluster assembly regulator [Rhodanobacteraceae bacterium]|nr:SUF system Fe-S cluster assembly regulator [Rhodanobacteraceae bacterium]MBK7044323.1 SUF system Fe-S cluster assembly regulator [Rhodanobacteraceae bacterium]MBP9155534.1 SUF system Fe-S cluster assembly regulator [Xanthomonadales bacterium]HQW81413.1 SUF system Fe-S cluster assembly regulator [Pseudomonadota bacterium]